MEMRQRLRKKPQIERMKSASKERKRKKEKKRGVGLSIHYIPLVRPNVIETLQLFNLVLLLIVLLAAAFLSGLLLVVLLTTTFLSGLLLVVLLLSGLLLIGLSGLLLIGLSRLLLIGFSGLLLIGLSRLLVGRGRLGLTAVVSTEDDDRGLAASALLDSADVLSDTLGGRLGVLHAEVISDSSGLVAGTLLDSAETLSSTLGGSLNVLHGHGITSHTRLLTSTLLDGADVLSNTLGGVSGLTDSDSVGHSSGLGDGGVLLAINLTVLTDEVGESELKTADGAFEASLVVGLLDGVDGLKRVGGLSADCTLCSRHPD